MIYYKCDMCQKETDKNKITILDKFPRRINTYIIGSHGEKLSCMNSYELKETHLCESCFKVIAHMSSVIEED